MLGLKSWNGLHYSDNELSIGYSYFAEIKQLIEKPYATENFHFVYDRCYRLFRGLPVPTIEVTEKGILRARRNFGDQLYSHQYEISYNKQCPNITALGRFNRPKESLFYGSLPLISEHASYLGTAVAESCKDMFDDLNDEPVFDFTVGQWIVRPFMAICLCTEDRHLSTNERMKTIVTEFSENISAKCGRLTAIFILEVWKFLSRLTTSKDKRAHLILTAWFNAIRMIYGNDQFEINGVVYPSAVTDSKGLNIVLLPEAVDNYLRLENATMFRAERWSGDKKGLDIYPITEIVKVQNRRFYFSDIRDRR